MLRIHERRMTQVEAAERLGLSIRQVERLYRGYKVDGAAALVSKKRGQPSTRRLADALRTRAVAIVRQQYGDFGPTLGTRETRRRRTANGSECSHTSSRTRLS